ncbi:MAG: DUF2802 domain-containing protein [Woeseia sp.]|nr:DUF2802 domain-containing protein [Woeseia sp.]MBT8096510.1 DUF2802 domain-containing protein [Woeseia sp.]NNE62022.1 DUF2802 domain-containing protein [Woeseia sp.]NNL54997.1 DUF2802 domain-containing protein [Woeseia sp.]
MSNFILQYLLPLASVVLLIACLINSIRLRFELNAYAENVLTLPAPVAAYDDTDLRRMVDRRMTMFEARLTKLVTEQQNALPLVAAAPVPPLKNELPVEYAVRMARSGATVDDLVRGCGLNIGEAQLLLRMHAVKRTSEESARH